MARRDERGQPMAIGVMLECGTQIGFLLSDGTVTDMTFCRSCANTLTPASYGPLWRAVLAATEDELESQGRRANEIKAQLHKLAGKWLVAPLYRRFLSSVNGTPEIDRRDADSDA